MKSLKYWMLSCLLIMIFSIGFYYIGYNVAYDRAENVYSDMQTETFYAEITAIEDTRFSVDGISVNDINYRGAFNFSIAEAETELEWRSTPMTIDEFDEGDLIAITFTGLIAESDPANIEKVVRIQLLDDTK